MYLNSRIYALIPTKDKNSTERRVEKIVKYNVEDIVLRTTLNLNDAFKFYNVDDNL
jgi:methyl coenzyme M reductase beta subunit